MGVCVCVCVISFLYKNYCTFFSFFTHTHTHLTALCPGLPGWAGTRKVKPTWILLKQETVSGSEIRWAICKSAPCSRQITMPAPHPSFSFFTYIKCSVCYEWIMNHWWILTESIPAQFSLRATVRVARFLTMKCGRFLSVGASKPRSDRCVYMIPV